ncbi:hypothetical protein J1N35_014016 [Gossypium stocksii]|uniref:Aminotransferase-like plant mobile domain-containing protein n=1 Tax=Gossypium stocksii TaxID=47602 RepID=A0A9D3VTZ7_9ROSI|nr:hypothetical protein J1N35_014016 [Gossypium stocksii]
MLGGCKLDPTIISALVERWRLETHTFHFSCDECTIILKDEALQLGLPMDGPVITGSTVIPGKAELCRAMLKKVSNKFDGVATTSGGLHRMRKTKLEVYHLVHVILGAMLSHDTDRWLSTPTAVVGLVVTTVSTS